MKGKVIIFTKIFSSAWCLSLISSANKMGKAYGTVR